MVRPVFSFVLAFSGVSVSCFHTLHSFLVRFGVRIRRLWRLFVTM